MSMRPFSGLHDASVSVRRSNTSLDDEAAVSQTEPKILFFVGPYGVVEVLQECSICCFQSHQERSEPPTTATARAATTTQGEEGHLFNQGNEECHMARHG